MAAMPTEAQAHTYLFTPSQQQLPSGMNITN